MTSDTLPTSAAAPSKMDPGLACLVIMAKLHNLPADDAKLQHEFGNNPSGFDDKTIVIAARSLGMTAKIIRVDPRRMNRIPAPVIAKDRNGGYFVLAKVSATQTTRDERMSFNIRVLIQRPGQPVEVLSEDEFFAMWSGWCIFFASKAVYADTMSKFDFSWFVPVVVKYRYMLAEVILVSIILQLIGLTTPMFFQVVMDKVLTNNAMKTLTVIAIGLVVAIIFEALLTGIRTYVLANLSSKIDVELGSKLFKHLLALPISYFHARRVGDSVVRVRELENIRHFLTSNAITAMLDFFFSFIFIGVMFLYSTTLAWIVVGSLPIYVLLSFFFTPIIQARLNDQFMKGAESQSFLVESISGVDTVKAMSVEPRWTHRWEQLLAAYVTSALKVENIGLIASGSVQFVNKLVGVLIMWLGAQLVIEGKLSVGQLIAFNMLSNQVAAPILRLAQLWNDFQQVGIAMSRLGDILNAKTEVSGQKTRIPKLVGSIEFDNVSFRYRPDAPDVIRGVRLRFAPGSVVGIVGRSGSGKSTLTKLVQRMYVPDRGRVLIDGQDIGVIDTTSLRHQIGVVLQENTLFSRSVRDNIALARPSASIEEIIHVAKLAGAHDFIVELPEGYDTMVGEHGTGLSGGQRQRVAIARALLNDPRILIFDEATSALDYESEKIIQDNMRMICQGRTVLIIAHRLSAVRDADQIVVMERGEVSEVGSHEELLRNPAGIYSHLYALQQGTGAM